VKFAICNELFEGWDFARVCRFVKTVGYEGLELAPFTLPPLSEFTRAARRDLRRKADDAGLDIVGLHWLLARTSGLHLTSGDAAVRRRTRDHLIALTEACADLGGSVMVFGSPAQRSVPAGVTMAEATRFAVEIIQQLTPSLDAFGVSLCLEPLAREETDFINACDDAVQLIEMIGHPRVMLHLDVKAMSSEPTPIVELIRRHGARTGHFHANDPNRRGPGFGAVDFTPVFAALREAGYNRWVSVEVFDYSPDAETIARRSLEYMKECS
jgi:sugar phosphate isomerase/epimerase